MSFLVKGGKTVVEWQWEKDWHNNRHVIPDGKMLRQNVYGEPELLDTVQPISLIYFLLLSFFWLAVIMGGVLVLIGLWG